MPARRKKKDRVRAFLERERGDGGEAETTFLVGPGRSLDEYVARLEREAEVVDLGVERQRRRPDDARTEDVGSDR